MAGQCIFCGIASGEIEARVVREDDRTIAFHDLDAKAPLHVLIIPKRHIASMNDLTASDAEVMGELLLAASEIATTEGLAADGYRVVMNTGAAAGQSVQHVHLHLLGGRDMSWPPG